MSKDKFVFHQSALIGRGAPGTSSRGVTFHRGVHVVPAKLQEDATFKHFAKHGLIVPFSAKEQGVLKPAESDAAKASAANAKAALAPDAEIGGDEAPVESEPEFPEDHGDDEKHHHKKKRK